MAAMLALVGSVAVGFSAAVVATTSGTAAASSATWTSSTAPSGDLSPSIVSGNVPTLFGVSCASATSCVAVGDYPYGPNANTDLDATASVIETGSESGGVWTWQAQTAPLSGLSPASISYSGDNEQNGDSNLQSVSCGSPTSCVAVGTYEFGQTSEYNGEAGFLEIGTGSGGSWSWTAESTQGATGSLDPAVYSYTGTGDQSDQADLGEATLTAVSCSGASCVATGSYETLVGTDSNGSVVKDSYFVTNASGSWAASNVPASGLSPAPADPDTAFEYPALSAVSCSTTTACVAVGYYYDSSGRKNGLIETGTESGGAWTWQARNAVNPAGMATSYNYFFNGVSCPSATECIVTGEATNDVVETGTLNAGSWTWVLNTAPPSQDYVNGSSVSCVSISSCVLTGSIYSVGPIAVGTESAGTWTWSVTAVPTSGLDPAANSSPDAGLAAVACISVTCVGVGSYHDASENSDGLIAIGAFAPSPVVNSISPGGGPLAGGNTVTITGADFEDSSLTLQSVSFDPIGDLNGTEAIAGTDPEVVNDTELTVTAPDATSAADGVPYLSTEAVVTFSETADPETEVVAPPASGGSSTLSYVFGAPVVDSVDPAAGPMDGGTSVTITGSGFANPKLDFEGVSFNTDDGDTELAGTSATVVSDTEITVTSPDATAAGVTSTTLVTSLAITFDNVADTEQQVAAVPATTNSTILTYVFGAPIVDSISPPGGPLAGGNTVTITGSGFENPSLTFDSVRFEPPGNTELTGTNATVVSDTEITVTAPDATTVAGGKPTLNATIQVLFDDPSDDGFPLLAVSGSSSSNPFGYVFGAPVLASVSPPAGPLAGGNTVTITGSGFSDPSLTLDKVTFDPDSDTNGSEVLNGTVATVVSDTEITVTAPDASLVAGAKSTVPAEIQVLFTDSSEATIDATVTGDANAYTFGTPVVDSMTPAAGPLAGGNTVTITGSGFDDPNLTFDEVQFDPDSDTDGSEALTGTDATVVSDTEITVSAPDATTAAGDANTLDTDIKVVYEDPADADTQILATNNGTDVNAYLFGAPVVDSIYPAAGPLGGGNTVTITGSGFENSGLSLDKVIFDPTTDQSADNSQALEGTDATVVSDTQITVVAPDATTAAGGKDTLATNIFADFTDAADPDNPVQAQPATLNAGILNYGFGYPQVDSVDPVHGPLMGGNTVTITGSGFQNPGLTIDTVNFDPTGDSDATEPLTATDVTVVSDTEITVTAPDASATAAAQTGGGAVETTVDVYFTDPPASGPILAVVNQADDNDYEFGAPTIRSVSPTAGPLAGGNTVTITGNGFEDSGLTLDGVQFAPGQGTALDATNVQVVSDTQITVTAPDATAAASPASTLSTNVVASFSLDGDPSAPFNATTAADGSSAYDFGTPQLSSVNPDEGTQDGGQTVTITGLGFQNPNLTLTSVQFDPGGAGSTPIDGLSPLVASDTKITVTTPNVVSQADGSDELTTTVVVNFEDTGAGNAPVSAVLTDGGDNVFDFDVPSISKISPDRGPLSGGNEITITGSGFENLGLTYDSLTFQPDGENSTPLEADDVDVVSDTEITATAPDGTDAAGGLPAVETTLTVNFTDPNDADAQIQSVPESTGDDDYWFGIPTVDSLNPDSGPVDGGNEITITGSGFEDSGLSLSKVEFTPTGGTALDGTDATVVSDTEITVTAPDATQAAGIHPSLATEVTAIFDFEGSQTQVVSSPEAAGDDTYTFAVPTISAMDPSIGPLGGGNTVTITGTGFKDLGLTSPTVSFAPVSSGDDSDSEPPESSDGTDVTVVSDTELTVLAPDVTDAADGAPDLDTTVTISFDNPDVEDAVVDSVASVSGADDYWFGPPTIDSVTPAAGPLAGGNTVTITGLGFQDSGLTLTGVTFDPVGSTDEADNLNGVSPTVVSNTKITVTAPSAATAAEDSATYDTNVTLHFADPDDPGQEIPSSPVAAGDDEYDFGTPLITSVSPPVGPLDGGNEITITGSGFDNPDLDLTSVDFQPDGDANPSNALEGTDPDVVSDTEITVTAPDATAAADEQTNLETTVKLQFTDTDDGDAEVTSVVQDPGDNDYGFGTPEIDSVSPELGPLAGGDEVTVTGTGFENPDLTFTGVTFTPTGEDEADGLAGVDATVVSDTEITVTAPDATEAADGASNLDTTVTADYTDSDEDQTPVSSVPEAEGDNDYSFGQPVIDSVTPDTGPLDGGDQITITGSGFSNPDLTFSGVNFDPQGDDDSAQARPHDDESALVGTDATVVSDTEITVTTPDATEAADGESTLDTTVEAEFTDAADNAEQVSSTVGPDGNDDYTFTDLPSAPTHVLALAGVGSATVTWSAPTTDGDDPLTSYTVTSVPGGIGTTVAGTATTATLSGLDVGTGYYFSVSATSDAGTGPASASNMVVPTSTPVMDSTSATGSTPGGSVSTSPVTAGGGASLTATAQGIGTVGAGTYSSDPVAQLSDGADYFDVDVSADNSFTQLSFLVCGLSAGQSLEWWNDAVDAWQAMSEQTTPSGTPLCVTATVTASTSPTIAQLYGTVIAVVGSSGYWEVARDGGVFAYGAPFHGSAAASHLNQPIVGMAPTPDGAGYWLVGRDGGVFTYGDAQFYGSLATRHLNRQVVGVAATPSGDGYWLVGADGGIFNFGDAKFYGSLATRHLNRQVVGIAATPSGNGYWLVGADGGIFTFGDAQFYGSLASQHLDRHAVGIASTPSGDGYWLVAADGGVFAFGDATYEGSMSGNRLNRSVVGMAATSDGKGYWLVGADGGVFTFGDARFYGSAASTRLVSHVAGVAGA